MGQRTAGDLMFEAYLTEHDYPLPEHEPDLGIGVRIEYVVERDGARCLTEVKQFATESNPIKGSGSYSQEQLLKPHRNQIHHAARKLRNATGLGLPLVVVLTDPAYALMGLMTPMEMIAAMMGDLSVQVPVGPDGPVAESSLVTGRNGEVRRDHAYVSAVVVIHAMPLGNHVAHTYVTNSPDAVPLPPVFFHGEDDLVFEYSEQAGTYSLRTQPSLAGPLLTVGDVAERVGVSTETVLRWVRQGEAPAIRLPGGGIRFATEEFDAWLRTRGVR